MPEDSLHNQAPYRTPLRRPVMRYSQQEGKKERISSMMAFLFIVTAFFIDCFEMLLEWLAIGILGLSTLISISATAGFWIIFKIKNVPFSGKPKNLARFGMTAMLEAVPGLDSLFGFVWTFGIFTLVASTMEEDGQSNMIVSLYQFTLKKIGL